MTKRRFSIPASCALALLAVAGIGAPADGLAQAASDPVTSFKLPPSPVETPAVQGPVAEGVRAPRAVRTAAPQPSPSPSPSPSAAPQPTAGPSAAPEAAPAQPSAREPTRESSANPPPVARPPVATPTPDQARPQTAAPSPAQPAPTPTQQAESAALPDAPQSTALPRNLPALPPAVTNAPSGAADETASWIWYLLAFIALWMAGGLFWLWRQRAETGGRVLVAPIQRPRIKKAEGNADDEAIPSPAFATGALPRDPAPDDSGHSDAPDDGSPLRCTIETSRLSLTLMNVSLAYRITLSNMSASAIRGITIGSDLVTAHANVPTQHQIAGHGQQLAPKHTVDLLLPDQNVQLSGELRLPIPAVHPLRRGDAVMFVPLLRLRIDGEGMEEIVLQTLVVGQKPAGPGAGLRPFRLDLGPRIYGDIGHRLLQASA